MTAKQTKIKRPTPNSAQKARKPKDKEEIAKELREQRALDPTRSEVENYLTKNPRHFGF